MNKPTPEKTIFHLVLEKKIPSAKVYEDEWCYAFKDISPQAPVHVLLIPKKFIAQLSKVDADKDKSLLGHMLSIVPKIAQQQGVGDAYRVVINDGADAGQTVFYLHIHILGGRPLQWPPG